MPANPPVAQKIWMISANNRIPFVSLNDTMGNYLKGVADFLLASGYTCKGSSDGTTAAMDGVNRWTTVANASVRGAGTSTANSWMVLTDASGCDILLSYVGATDDVGRISYSPTSNFVVAGTATFTPTSVTELVMTTGVTLINNVASLDRIWHGWVDSTSKMCRFLICRSTALAGTTWGVELISSRVLRSFSPTVWGFAYTPVNMTWTAGGLLGSFSLSSRGGQIRVDGVTVNCGGVAEYAPAGSATAWSAIKTELQKGVGYTLTPMSIGSTTTDMQGPVGDLYDWWSGRGGGLSVPGEWFDNLKLIQFGDGSNAAPGSGIVWPWDGATIPQVA